MSFKIILFLILLLTPPYGWVGLFLWLVWHATCESMKADKEKPAAASPASPPSVSADKQEPELLTAKVVSGRCDLYSLSTGTYVRSLGSDVVQACAGRDYVALVTRRGETEIYSASTGGYIRRLSSNAVCAQIQGDDIAITDQNGRVSIYNISNGSYLRSL